MAEFSLPNFLAGLVVAGLASGGFAAAAGAFATTPAPAAQAAASPAPAPVQAAPARPASNPARLAPLPTTEALRAAGISDPISIERDDGLIEVEHRDSAGQRVKTRLDPVTHAVVGQRKDDDDRDGERDND